MSCCHAPATVRYVKLNLHNAAYYIEVEMYSVYLYPVNNCVLLMFSDSNAKLTLVTSHMRLWCDMTLPGLKMKCQVPKVPPDQVSVE